MIVIDELQSLIIYSLYSKPPLPKIKIVQVEKDMDVYKIIFKGKFCKFMIVRTLYM